MIKKDKKRLISIRVLEQNYEILKYLVNFDKIENKNRDFLTISKIFELGAELYIKDFLHHKRSKKIEIEENKTSFNSSDYDKVLIAIENPNYHKGYAPKIIIDEYQNLKYIE